MDQLLIPPKTARRRSCGGHLPSCCGNHLFFPGGTRDSLLNAESSFRWLTFPKTLAQILRKGFRYEKHPRDQSEEQCRFVNGSDIFVNGNDIDLCKRAEFLIYARERTLPQSSADSYAEALNCKSGSRFFLLSLPPRQNSSLAGGSSP
jgi:hypothetical protein